MERFVSLSSFKAMVKIEETTADVLSGKGTKILITREDVSKFSIQINGEALTQEFDSVTAYQLVAIILLAEDKPTINWGRMAAKALAGFPDDVSVQGFTFYRPDGETFQIDPFMGTTVVSWGPVKNGEFKAESSESFSSPIDFLRAVC